jgi:hypothetical protein
MKTAGVPKVGLKGSLYADVKRLQVTANKFIEQKKFEQAKTMLEKALRLY